MAKIGRPTRVRGDVIFSTTQTEANNGDYVYGYLYDQELTNKKLKLAYLYNLKKTERIVIDMDMLRAHLDEVSWKSRKSSYSDGSVIYCFQDFLNKADFENIIWKKEEVNANGINQQR